MEGDGNHVLDQAVLDYCQEFSKTVSGTGEPAHSGKKRLREAKLSKSDKREKRQAMFKNEVKGVLEKKEQERAASALLAAAAKIFSDNMAVLNQSGKEIAVSIRGAAAASMALANYRLFGIKPDAALSMPFVSQPAVSQNLAVDLSEAAEDSVAGPDSNVQNQ